MQVNGFKYCCGTFEIGNFMPDSVSPGDITTAMKRWRESHGYGYAIATTIPEQKSAIHALKEAGFKELANFHNPNSDNEVTVWGRHTRTPSGLGAKFKAKFA